MLLSFLAGVIVGAAALAYFATWFADRPKPKATQHGIAATSVSVNGGGTYAETLADAMRVFREPQGRA